jgi:hypothetical protein
MWLAGRRRFSKAPFGRNSVFIPDVTDYEWWDINHLGRLTKTMKYSRIRKFKSDIAYQQHTSLHHCCLQYSNNYRLSQKLGDYSLGSQWEGLGSIPGQSMCDLWWTKWQWDRFFQRVNSVFPWQSNSPCSLNHLSPALYNLSNWQRHQL